MGWVVVPLCLSVVWFVCFSALHCTGQIITVLMVPSPESDFWLCKAFFHSVLKAFNDWYVFPALLSGPVSQHKDHLFALPFRFGGLGIGDLVGALNWHFNVHVRMTLYWCYSWFNVYGRLLNYTFGSAG